MNNKLPFWHRVATPLILVISVAGISCYPDYGLTAADYDAVLTFPDANFSFAALRTYVMPDTAYFLDSADNIGADWRYNSQIISDIARNMTAYGYTRVSRDSAAINRADLVLIPFLRKVTTVGVSYPYYGYWCYWYPWYCGYGWGYYPGYPTYYSYSTGTVGMFLVPGRQTGTDSMAVPRWTGILNGVMNVDTEAGVRSRLTNGINAAFSQSPYLKVN